MKQRKPNSRRSPDGFTLVEILIVVVILGILAALVIPQFSNAAHITQENAMREDLRNLRTLILIYSTQHNDIPPGHPGGDPNQAPTSAAFVLQMVSHTDTQGNVGAQSNSTYKFGPYLRVMPTNPINNLATIRVIGAGAFPTEAAGTHGWIYQPSTMTFSSDATGSDDYGTPYIDY